MEMPCSKPDFLAYHESWVILALMVCVSFIIPFHIFKVVLKLLLDIVNLLDMIGSCWARRRCWQSWVEAGVETIIGKEEILPHGDMVGIVI